MRTIIGVAIIFAGVLLILNDYTQWGIVAILVALAYMKIINPSSEDYVDAGADLFSSDDDDSSFDD
ncbi:MAG: hypothetical protein D6B28_05705 [Gammaproteobacteria bacterium]|nr:MAG: hypothetical protein D6B28_05705 [Gammaproteobacteria bacterium]